MPDPTATSTVPASSLADIATPDGTFAIVAMDQRNTLRRMYAAAGIADPSDAELVAATGVDDLRRPRDLHHPTPGPKGSRRPPPRTRPSSTSGCSTATTGLPRPRDW